MRRFLYGIIFLLILIIVKAFYFDGWLEKRRLDTNSSVEANQTNSDNAMPVSEIGDGIAKKLNGKI